MHYILIVFTASYLGVKEMPVPSYYEVPTKAICEFNEKINKNIYCVTLTDEEVKEVKPIKLKVVFGALGKAFTVKLAHD
jgi:hypothetical protein